MANIEKFRLPNGSYVDAERIEITNADERWNEYLLDDGSVLKLKPVASRVVRLTDQYDQVGNPVYFINSTNVISVVCPDSLKKKN